MTNTQYKRMTLAEMKLRKWRLAREVQTGMMLIPRGAVVSIDDKQNGLCITGPPCPHCGVAVRARKVDADALEEITGEEECKTT